MSGTAGEYFTAFAETLVDVAEYALVLLLAHEWSHLRIGAAPAAEFHGPGDLLHAAHHVVKDGLFDEQASACYADLAVVEKHGVGGAGDRLIEIGISRDDHRTLATQFERYTFQTLHRDLANVLAHRSGTGESNLAHQ